MLISFSGTGSSAILVSCWYDTIFARTIAQLATPSEWLHKIRYIVLAGAQEGSEASLHVSLLIRLRCVLVARRGRPTTVPMNASRFRIQLSNHIMQHGIHFASLLFDGAWAPIVGGVRCRPALVSHLSCRLVQYIVSDVF